MIVQYLSLLGFTLLVVFGFIVTYLLNENTQAPDIDVDISGCGGCHNISCGHHSSRKVKKEVN